MLPVVGGTPQARDRLIAIHHQGRIEWRYSLLAMQVPEELVSGFDGRLRLQLEELVFSICKALNDPKRLMLLYSLREGRRTVSELCRMLGTPQSNTSQHLAVLRERGLVSTERQGNSILYSLRYPQVLEAVDVLREIMSVEVDRQQELRSTPRPAPMAPVAPSRGARRKPPR